MALKQKRYLIHTSGPPIDKAPDQFWGKKEDLVRLTVREIRHASFGYKVVVIPIVLAKIWKKIGLQYHAAMIISLV